MNIKLLGNNLLMQRSISQMRGYIALPANATVTTSSCKVINKGPKVSSFIKNGDFVLCHALLGSKVNSSDGLFFCKEKDIFAVVRNNIIFPFGITALIERDVTESHVGSILIPENRRIQSLFGTVVRLGISRSKKRLDLKVGDKVRLHEWQPEMIEVTLPGNKYGLIVNEKDILFKFQDEEN